MRKKVKIYSNFREDYKKIKIMHSHQKIEFIESEMFKIPLYGKKVGLENMKRLIREIDKAIPIVDYLEMTPIIHVTGTNGKGSVCNMLSRIYAQAGYRVGMFTSPHMDHITERIQINNENVGVDLFSNAFHIIDSICSRLKTEAIEPTFFEWMFSIALICFYKAESDFLVLEVGIGGRLDTTNVIPKKILSILAPIGFDHQHLLGNSLEEIALEKAGIIQEGGKVVLYNDQPEVNAIVWKKAAEKNAQCYNVLPATKKIGITSHLGIDFSVYNKYYKYDSIFLPTVCDYQIDNASIALTAVAALQDHYPVNEDQVLAGLRAFYWPGRFEVLHKNLIIDGAHNAMGAEKLVDTLRKLYFDQAINLLIAIKEGKNYEDILNIFADAQIFQKVYIYEMHSTPSVSKDTLQERLQKKGYHCTVVEELHSFLEDYLQNSDTLLIGAGSLYLMSEIRKAIVKED